MARGRKFYVLNAVKDGIGGGTYKKPRERKQDKRAKPGKMYAVVFFPKITGIGKARVDFWGLHRTLAQSPKAAIAKFMDSIRQGEKWSTYAEAGHRVRKVRISDMGPA